MLYAFDGTWQLKNDEEPEDPRNSNVARFLELYEATTRDPDGGVLPVDEEYLSGVGTMSGRLGRWLGGGLGIGGKNRVEQAYAELCENWDEGDTDIHIVGFSRGAALALDFANLIRKRGIVRPGPARRVADGRSRRPRAEDVVEANPEIGFIGLWDTVVAIGLPSGLGRLPLVGPVVGILGSGLSRALGYRFGLPTGVGRCVHALAGDERRLTFWPRRVKGAYEVWFEGGHSDVGGGNRNIARNNITLAWMGEQAAQVGLPINAGGLREIAAAADADAPVRSPSRGAENRRRIHSGDLRHQSVRMTQAAIAKHFEGTVLEGVIEEGASLAPEA